LAAAKETVAMLPARCYTRIVIQQTQRPVARHTAAGFSLLELFLMAVIIFIPFTFSISPRSKSHQDKASAECRNHRQNICAALRTFSGENHNRFGGNFLFCAGNVRTTPARTAFPLPQGTDVILLNPKP
jgi:hypothetical protein